ncbi:helix-turn-helix transcriptional regulator [Paenibacillus sp. FSL M8-0228]|jgi:transcriptional regulator with XRE-family HTH domain|uniref:helix-turn-helix domain-containing protein n=1 Tax=Paenibacillus TaxID=44249 RepID=UPI00083D2699|nr:MULTISPECIES: helix-turn-helix transcriptional regulator [Paenibacillus]MBO3287201.1 helix-turn-helix transcriptional regulator [Paenibacillus polymyxa]MBP1312390.1 transcriptional regulator with XRE-family HTH domain [Paenibacillus sp. 1182]ODB53450.1 hypothetical protein A7311_23675 [Paenibacillus polymyxa]
MSELKTIIGYKIREIRRARSLSQEQLGEKVDMSQSYIGEIERGEVNVSLETLDKLTRALDVTMLELLRLENIQLDSIRSNKMTVIQLLQELLIQKSLEEISMIYRITNDIFETTGGTKNK